jgi:2-polyprenyl-3-methyl-5-hydroxy-6-metoxy-1,4-benzoquinol methylase
MNYTENVKIGLKRAINSPGAFANWQKGLGYKRALAEMLKLANIALTPLAPLGVKTEITQRSLVCPPEISKGRLEVARNFFASFSNRTAKEFVKSIMVENYASAIVVHHPTQNFLDHDLIRIKCEALIKTIFRRLEDIKTKPHFLYDFMVQMSRGTKPAEGIWFKEYIKAYEQYKHGNKLAKRDTLLYPFVVGESIVDIGCGGGDQVANFIATHPELKRAAGIDILNWKTPGLNINYHVIDFKKPGTASPEAYDTGLLLAVLHHVGNTESEIGTFLTGVRTAVKKRLIVEEDVLLASEDLRTDIVGMEEIAKLRSEQPTLDKYLKFDTSTQRDIATLIDLLGNSLSVGVPDMAFPFGFRTLGDWKRTFESNGFNLNRIKLLGFQRGNFNQQCHVLFILDKTS